MRALGKGSLASILSVGLHIARIILMIGLFGLAVAVVALPIIPMFVDWISGMEHVETDLDVDIDVGDFLGVAYHFVTFWVMFYIVNRLLEILKTLRFGSPFVKENAERFRRVGFALLVDAGAKFAFGILSIALDADIEIHSNLTTWIAIAAVFVLAEVFHEGARLKEEQDLTV